MDYSAIRIGEIPDTETRQPLAKDTHQFVFEQLLDLAEPLISNES